MKQFRKPHTQVIYPPRTQYEAERLRLYRTRKEMHAEYRACQSSQIWRTTEFHKRLDKRINQFLMDTIMNEWWMETSDYQSYIQWLPKELMEELEGYIRHFHWK